MICRPFDSTPCKIDVRPKYIVKATSLRNVHLDVQGKLSSIVRGYDRGNLPVIAVAPPNLKHIPLLLYSSETLEIIDFRTLRAVLRTSQVVDGEPLALGYVMNGALKVPLCSQKAFHRPSFCPAREWRSHRRPQHGLLHL